MASKYFITTPIFYANSSPHLGHLYTVVIADAMQRFQQLLSGKPVIFSTGMDEHGLKIQQAAISANSTPTDLCHNMSQKFMSMFDKFGIQYSNFIRTSEENHCQSVQMFFQDLSANGYIYKKKYEGWYCVSDETFVTEKQVEEKSLENGQNILVSKDSGHVVEWNCEENYIFKLSNFQKDLLHWLNTNNVISPIRFQEELKHWIESALYDLSISRLSARVSWGVPVPGDSDHTIYVWMDALVNYLTVAGYPSLKSWPPDLQIIGKDILRFHGMYWPALLIAAGLDPPKRILVHSHWKADGVKMSKSLGNVVCPLYLLNLFNSDAVRYILLKSGGYDTDRSWSNELAVQMVNTDLANTVGNLLSRSTASSLNPSQYVPKLDEQFLKTASPTCLSLLDTIKSLPDKVEYNYSKCHFSVGIEEIMSMVRLANLFFEQEKPWELKNESNRSKIDSILFIGMLAVRSAALLLQPVVPDYANQLLNILNITKNERKWSHIKFTQYDKVFNSASLGKKSVPFKRIKL